MKEMYNFIGKHLKYPIEARSKNIQGKVYIAFIVNKDGTLSDFKVVKSVYPSLDEEALRVIKLFPNWIPATIDSEPVDVNYTLPISYNIY